MSLHFFFFEVCLVLIPNERRRKKIVEQAKELFLSSCYLMSPAVHLYTIFPYEIQQYFLFVFIPLLSV